MRPRLRTELEHEGVHLSDDCHWWARVIVACELRKVRGDLSVTTAASHAEETATYLISEASADACQAMVKLWDGGYDEFWELAPTVYAAMGA